MSDISHAHVGRIARELKLAHHQVEATIELLDDGATVPFIARYRKEVTGSLDEVQITAIRDMLEKLRELDKRREAILASLEERELLTDELQEQIDNAQTMAELEDIYLPFKPKRRTRATIAREKGLEPLAEIIFAQEPHIDPESEAQKFVDPEKEVETVEDALDGARDIIAEWINEDTAARSSMRELFQRKGLPEFQSRFRQGGRGFQIPGLFRLAGTDQPHRLASFHGGHARGKGIAFDISYSSR